MWLTIIIIIIFSAKAFQKILWRLCPREVQKLLKEDEKVRHLWWFLFFLLQTRKHVDMWVNTNTIFIQSFILLDQVSGEIILLYRQLQTE